MRSIVTLSLIVPLAAATLACGGDRPDMDLGGRDIGPDRFAVTSTDGNVRMALTDGFMYFALTEQMLDEVRDEMREATEQEGVAGRIGGFVERTVGKALQARALYPLDEVEAVRWEDDAMRVVFTRRGRSIDDAFRISDEPITTAFSEDAVRAFGEELRVMKASRSGSR